MDLFSSRERQKAAEALPDVQRRETLRYDSAMARLAKGVCPGCERPVDLKDGKVDFCPHCGIGLFDKCRHCSAQECVRALLLCMRHASQCQPDRLTSTRSAHAKIIMGECD